jgi:hypothetical protein
MYKTTGLPLPASEVQTRFAYYDFGYSPYSTIPCDSKNICWASR